MVCQMNTVTLTEVTNNLLLGICNIFCKQLILKLKANMAIFLIYLWNKTQLAIVTIQIF